MRAKLTLLSALVVGTFGGVLAGGCQTYDFEPVEPLAISQTTETREVKARNNKPNLMLLVDTSGSMTAPVDKTDRDCWVGGNSSTLCGTGDQGPCNTSVCPTRWTALQDAMKDFLQSSGTIARIGLTTYPDANDVCGASTSVSIPLPADGKEDDVTLQSNAAQVNTRLQSIKNYSTSEPTPSGGTPTSESLKYVGGLPELQGADRSDFVVLLTDGLPNCNANYPDAWPSSSCFCTLGSSCAGLERQGCLDANASVDAVKALAAKDIKTIIIGFGADFDSTQPNDAGSKGAATLSAMAEAGGFARACTVNADCGTNETCDTAKQLCTRSFYKAANAAELVAALRQISEKVQVGNPCAIQLEPAPDSSPYQQELIVVYINGERQEPGTDTWTLAGSTVTFQGALCQRINSSTPTNPVNIEVRAVQRR
jgi:von Willebrand factor type A domain